MKWNTPKPKMSHDTHWIVRATYKPGKYLVMKNSYSSLLKNQWLQIFKENDKKIQK